MEIKAKTRTEQILVVMHILAWVAFVGFCIKAGAIAISYAVSLINSLWATNLYMGLSFPGLREFNVWHYTGAVSFVMAITCLKAFASWLVIKTLSKVNLENPFRMEVAKLLERTSYILLDTWVVGMIGNAHISWLVENGGISEPGEWMVGGEFIFMAGLVFIMAHIFKRGVEIQSENELTV